MNRIIMEPDRIYQIRLEELLNGEGEAPQEATSVETAVKS